ncbi:lipid II flippase MurJ [Bifidobacterium sp.]|jgi:putative peptidoglycan lipid II flippase|uniref:lipid II flippase MurJ n=1 Tax=Bifidobacterium sp. TaxID=41200 RepID=UPI0025B871C9|nr:lipid II flippase MurJ [Bifidobacterium sp.]MCH4209535.1 hypothetical protein [Bifidobacterium sp.]
MTSTVGRNSLIMASGTAASRITGQIRTILLASAVGTTGIAANAYQAGSMIPQEVFTLVSGGIFNAVLVPQIVRTLQRKDAEDRLNKLITFVIALLLGITLLMTLGTPLLTRLYVRGDGDMLALTNAFTLWCMPQIFFYGLYTVIGQILAAKDHFGMYAWSSVGANIISSAGFIAFIVLFGRANRRPIGFWTPDKITLTAGAWTLGVAFQALVLFFPLRKIGIRYRLSWGIKGIGLRAMGPVAAWSIGIVVVGQLANIVDTNVTTSAPDRAAALFGLSQYQVAGNASYQNAYTIYLLPYALIAVSVATAVFPKIAQAIASHDLDGARKDLSQALRNVGLLMCFFTVAFLVMPTPITLALLPSVSVHEALLIAGPMVALAVSLPLASAYLIIQRTFYAFEDGRHPFLFIVLQTGFQLIVILIGVLLLSPVHWATLLGASISIGYLLAFPILAVMIHRRFNGRVDGKRIVATYTKALIAMGAAVVGGLWLRQPAYTLVGAHMDSKGGTMNWFQAVAVCLILGVIVTVLYAGVLWLLRTQEFILIAGSLSRRLLRRRAGHQGGAVSASTGARGATLRNAPARNIATGDIATHSVIPQDSIVPQDIEATSLPPMFDPATHALIRPDRRAESPRNSASPTGRISTAPQSFAPPSHRGVEGTMEPELGDVVINRYTLVSLLRAQPGLQAWKANDRVLARYCQLFLVNDADVVPQINAIASSLALSRNAHVTPVLQLQHRDGIAIVVTQLDAGSALSEYCQGRADRIMNFSAMRSILALSAQLARQLLDGGLERLALNTDTIRVTAHGVQFADVPLGPILDDVSRPPQALHSEQLAIWQLAAVLYALLTDTPSAEIGGAYDLKKLPNDTPDEFRLICKRGLGLRDESGNASIAMLALDELIALLGEWKPMSQLSALDMTKPGMNGPVSISTAMLRNTTNDRLLDIPGTVFTSEKLPAAAPNTTIGVPIGAAAAVDKSAGIVAGIPAGGDSDEAFDNAAAGNDAVESAAVTTPGVWGAGVGALKSFWNRGKSALTSTDHDAVAQQNSQDGDIPAFRDIAAAEMAEIIAPGDTEDSGTLFPNFDFTTGGATGGTTTNPTMQFDFSSPQFMNAAEGMNDPSTQPFAATGRIPVIDENGDPVEPGAESRRALMQEREQRDAAQRAERDDNTGAGGAQGKAYDNAQGNPRGQGAAKIDAAGVEQSVRHTTPSDNNANNVATLPPSFTPTASAARPATVATAPEAPQDGLAGGDAPNDDLADDDIADTPLFGGFTTKIVSLVVVTLVVVAALFLALRGLSGQSSNGVSQSGSNPWPSANLNDVPFGPSTGASASDDNAGSPSAGASESSTPQQSASGDIIKKATKKPRILTADKNVKQVPAPKVPLNTTPYHIDRRSWVVNPGGQLGYAYYMHLSQPEKASRFVITIRSSGGQGYLFANTTNDPKQGEQVAEFTFDSSLTTEVTFTKPVTSQDFLMWVPRDSLPNRQLYVTSVQIY